MGNRLKLAGIPVISLLLILCLGCGSKQSVSYASVLNYNDEEYIGKGIESAEVFADADLTLAGRIQKQLEPDQYPDTNLSSNELQEGTEIYIVNDDMLVALQEDRSFKVFERMN
ncbi:hypothetical protein AWU65_15565 [Paenibacillus glucanolyticus]|uniref:Uncharacterized protein n=1 Tax=Paenibacillus glucanolyticus TaxID=59843 RepID=A0A163KI34_9BACL|nr:hypothetical protein [Paenibacillus glucanolyticus]KZS47244.1 hypothetical protein AWU65_15565 [Paenibacillus glucanolyticus]